MLSPPYRESPALLEGRQAGAKEHGSGAARLNIEAATGLPVTAEDVVGHPQGGSVFGTKRSGTTDNDARLLLI